MSTSIYSRLQFNFTPSNNEILLLSDDTKDSINSMPKLLEDWQVEDIANDDVGGYFKNPVANSTNSLLANTFAIEVATSNPIEWGDQSDRANLLSLRANTFGREIAFFLSHTNNVSGVTPISAGGDDTVNFPYYDTATGFGRLLIFLTNQSDGVLNNSPIIGSMTSLFIEEELTANDTIISTDLATINASYSGGFYTLSNSEINVIITHIETANSLIATRRNHDITFYRNARDIIDDYGSVNKFSNMGETQTRLSKEYVGTDKLKQRLANT